MTDKQQKEFDVFLARIFPNGTKACEDKGILYLSGSDNQLKTIERELKKRKIRFGDTYMTECGFTQVIIHHNNINP